MYQIKPKKTSYFLLTAIGLLALAAIGAGIGYAGARLSGRTPEGEYIQNFTPSVPTEAPPSQDEEKTEVVISTETEVTVPDSVPKEEFMYLIKLENGKTKVYSLAGGAVVYSHELPVESEDLPPNDLTSLKEGIYLKNKDELLSFTEDFCS